MAAAPPDPARAPPAGAAVRLSIGGSSGGLYGVLLVAAERSLRVPEPGAGGRSAAEAAVAAFSAGVEVSGRWPHAWAAAALQSDLDRPAPASS
jgi:hypothetical protein